MARVGRALLRLDLLAFTAFICDSEPWVLIIPGAIEALGICSVSAAWRRPSSPRLLRWALELDRLTALMFFWSLAFILNHVTGAQEPMSPTAVGFGGLVTVEVGRNMAKIDIDGTASLELSTEHEADERIAMVLCRLFKDSRGRPLLTHQQIADAFSKGSRQACHNHIQQFDRAGQSLARMVLEGQRGRLSKLHPAVLARIAYHWERTPLASLDEICSWLETQSFDGEVALPSVEELRSVRCIEGNLKLMHNATARLLRPTDTGASLRPDLLLDRLFELIDEQDRRLREAGLAPVVPDAALAQEIAAHSHEPKGLSKTGNALVFWLTRLTSSPSEQDDAELSRQVGTKTLAPLHFGALYCLLGLSIGQVAALVGRSKSVVYRGLVALERALSDLDPFPAAAGFSGVLGIDEKWVKIPKSFSEKERGEGKKWRYAFFAVDALSGDLLHVELYDKVDSDTVRGFLVTLRAMGIRPKAVVTDMLAAYDQAIEEVFGKRVVHHFCLFHHLQAVRARLRERCGSGWKQEPMLRKLVKDIDAIYACKSRQTAKKRLAEVLAQREALEREHPAAVGILDILEQRFPLVVNSLGRGDIPSTNNVTERTIKAFHRHYQHFAGLESLETARVQLRLFRHFYRLTPLREAAQEELRGLCVLERAGWVVRGVPLADYVRRFTESWAQEGPELLSPESMSPFLSARRGVASAVEAQAA